ncbi:MAG: hypothetical protein M3Z06_07915, partial [Actinomycetota bacterium]|nr:hypothetical protein [Actinomycetota bacterium]
LEIVTIVVGIVGIVVAATPYFRPSRVLDGLGRQGQIWFESPAERGLDVQPSEDAVDDPIPRRPLRARALPEL